MHRIRLFSLVTLCASSLLLSACASNRPIGTRTKQIERTEVVTVESIDVPNRLVTVKTASNDYVTVYVDKSHTDFPMAAVGDKVRVRYVQSLAVKLANSGTPAGGLKYKEETKEPAKGRPSGEAQAELNATVRIESVNADGSIVLFTGPRGRRAIDVQDPAMRDFARKLKPGDNVDVTYKEAVALSLEKVKR